MGHPFTDLPINQGLWKHLVPVDELGNGVWVLPVWMMEGWIVGSILATWSHADNITYMYVYQHKCKHNKQGHNKGFRSKFDNSVSTLTLWHHWILGKFILYSLFLDAWILYKSLNYWLRREFIKEDKKVRKQVLDQESDKEKNKVFLFF